MIVGITGTRKTPHSSQEAELAAKLAGYASAVGDDGLIKLYHGDCTGADELAHDFGKMLGYHVEVFPPRIAVHRAYKVGDVMHREEDYPVRNRMIAEQCDLLIAVPEGPESQHPRSGTWQTVRMVRNLKKPIEIIKGDVW